jgi:hypothetical protein
MSRVPRAPPSRGLCYPLLGLAGRSGARFGVSEKHRTCLPFQEIVARLLGRTQPKGTISAQPGRHIGDNRPDGTRTSVGSVTRAGACLLLGGGRACALYEDRGLRPGRRPAVGCARGAERVDRLAMPAPLRLGVVFHGPARRREPRPVARSPLGGGHGVVSQLRPTSWLVSALALNGRVGEARLRFEAARRVDQRPRPACRGVRRHSAASGRQPPQAFSHLALSIAAANPAPPRDSADRRGR